MMKILFMLVTGCLLGSSALAQINADSIAYENQREKINGMLAERVAKFSEYDSSLNKRSGIFGMQTKKDIRRSNEILMAVVSTDNEILRQTKVLLNLKTNQLNARVYQQQAVEGKVKTTETDVMGYMTTINKLRAENERLQLNERQTEKNLANMQLKLVIVIAVFIITSILLIVHKNRAFKA